MSKFISKLKFVPNTLTCSSAFCGMLAIILALDGERSLVYAAYLILLASVFDFSDGFAARLLHAPSAMGKELDSLSDAISFGVAPTMITFQMLRESLRLNGRLLVYNNTGVHLNCEFWQALILICSIAIGICAVLRLAKFNIDPEQAHSFKGLPSPACAIFIASIPIINQMVPEDFWLYNLFKFILHKNYFDGPDFALLGIQVYVFGKWMYILPMCVIMGLMMVTNIPMFSLKQKTRTMINFLIYSAILLIILEWIAVPIIMISYVIVSLVIWLKNRNSAEEVVEMPTIQA